MSAPKGEPGPMKEFDPADFAAKLRVPPGTRYVEATGANSIRQALDAGLAVYVQSCDGRAFVWKQGDEYLADRFFMGPARRHRFESQEEAVDFASGLCE